MRETMVRLKRVDGHYEYNGYEVEQFGDRWYIFNGAHWVADFPTLNHVREWLGEH